MAGALAKFFERVEVFERDRLAAFAASRTGTPQDRHPHGLLAGGLKALGEIFPGFESDLARAGAVAACCRSPRCAVPIQPDPWPVHVVCRRAGSPSAGHAVPGGRGTGADRGRAGGVHGGSLLGARDAVDDVDERRLAFPATRGERPNSCEDAQQFEAALFRAAVADPVVHRAVMEVGQLLQPQSLQEPEIMQRIETLSVQAAA